MQGSLEKMTHMIPEAPVLTTPPPRVLLTLGLHLEPRLPQRAAAAIGPCQTQMCAWPQDTGGPRRGGGEGCNGTRPSYSTPAPILQIGGEMLNLLVPRQRQEPGRPCLQHMHGAVVIKRTVYEDICSMPRSAARPGCSSVATPRLSLRRVRGASQACKAAILKWISQLQTRRRPNLSFPFLPPLL